MDKSIVIVDEQGRQKGTTFPRRARGLVKKGRAYYISEDTLCMANPPEVKEEINMSDRVSERELFEQMNKLQEQMDSMKMLFEEIKNIPDDNVDIVNSKIRGINDIFNNRENTLKNMMYFYKDMYSNLQSQQ